MAERGWAERIRLGFWYRAAVAVGFSCTVGFALVYVSFLVPNGAQIAHLRESFAEPALHDPRLRTRVVEYAPRRSTATPPLMPQSECRTVTIGIADADGRIRRSGDWPSIRDAAMSPTFGGGETSCTNLHALLFPDQGAEPVTRIKPRNYFRYWNGYSVITRPMLAVLPFDRVRQALWLAAFGLGAALAAMSWRRRNATLAAALVAPALIMNYERIGQLITDSWCWLIAFGAAIIALRLLGRHDADADAVPPLTAAQRSLMWVLLAAGIAAAFLDRITIPLITLLVPLMVVLANEDGSTRGGVATDGATNGRSGAVDRLRRHGSVAAWLTAAWGFGYVTTFGARWVIGAIVTAGDNVSELEEGVSRHTYGGAGGYGFFDPITETIGHALAATTRLDAVLLVVAVVVVVGAPALRRRLIQAVYDNPVVLLLVAAPVPWLLVLSHHSAHHAYFTQYIWYPSMVAICYFAFEVVNRSRHAVRQRPPRAAQRS